MDFFNLAKSYRTSLSKDEALWSQNRQATERSYGEPRSAKLGSFFHDFSPVMAKSTEAFSAAMSN